MNIVSPNRFKAGYKVFDFKDGEHIASLILSSIG